MKIRIARTAVILGILADLALGTDNPFIGTWKLNVEKSQVSSGQTPAGRIMKIEAEGKDIVITLTGGGLTENVRQKIVFDKRQHPTAKSPLARLTGATSFAASESHGGGFEIVYKKDGKNVATQKRTIAENGRSLTSVMDGVSTDGKNFHEVFVYDKQ